MISTINDYQGRTVDLLAFKGGTDPGDTLTTQALVLQGGSGEIIAGPAKLAQRWLLEFLTEEGSLAYLPLRGTIFMTEARLGRFRTTVDAEQVFYFAADQAKLNLLAEEDANTPDDEAYADVELNNLVITGDLLIMNVTLISRAGSSRKVLFPLTIRTG